MRDLSLRILSSRGTVLLINLLMTILAIGLYHYTITTKLKSIARVNVTKIIETEMARISKLSDPEKNKTDIAQFGKRLETSIQNLAREKNIVLLPIEAVVSGAPDLTEELKQQMGLRHHE